MPCPELSLSLVRMVPSERLQKSWSNFEVDMIHIMEDMNVRRKNLLLQRLHGFKVRGVLFGRHQLVILLCHLREQNGLAVDW